MGRCVRKNRSEARRDGRCLPRAPLTIVCSERLLAPLAQYLLLDPTGAEEAAAEGTVTLAFLPSLAKVSQLSSTGSWSQTAFNQAVQLAVGGCLRLGTALREVLVASVA